MTETLTTTALDTDAVERVMAQHDADGTDMYGWILHRNTEDPSNALITCDTTDNWLPGQAARQAVARLITTYAESLRAAGFGTATWTWHGQDRALIVATDQGHADAIAPGIRAHLSELNPED